MLTETKSQESFYCNEVVVPIHGGESGSPVERALRNQIFLLGQENRVLTDSVAKLQEQVAKERKAQTTFPDTKLIEAHALLGKAQGENAFLNARTRELEKQMNILLEDSIKTKITLQRKIGKQNAIIDKLSLLTQSKTREYNGVARDSTELSILRKEVKFLRENMKRCATMEHNTQRRLANGLVGFSTQKIFSSPEKSEENRHTQSTDTLVARRLYKNNIREYRRSGSGCDCTHIPSGRLARYLNLASRLSCLGLSPKSMLSIGFHQWKQTTAVDSHATPSASSLFNHLHNPQADPEPKDHVSIFDPSIYLRAA